VGEGVLTIATVRCSLLMLSAKATIPRCAACGHRRPSAQQRTCPECGNADAPIIPLTAPAVRTLVRRAAFQWIIICSSMLIASAPANLAVATDSLPLYIAGGVFFMGAIVFVLAMSLGATAAALRPAAHVWWTWRDGETGPWSRGSRRAMLFVGLLITQLAVAALFGLIGWMLSPEYPGGWR
jgi:hypothetical protein